MDYQSIIQYEGQNVNITLVSNFWYRCRILSVTEHAVKFVSEDGKTITVSPDAILMIIPKGAGGR